MHQLTKTIREHRGSAAVIVNKNMLLIRERA